MRAPRMPPLPPERPFAILDLDGTLVRGDEVCPGARDIVAAFGNRCAIASNNSTDGAAEVAARLAALGIRIAAERIVLAGIAALEFLRHKRPGARVMLIAGAGLRREAAARGIVCVEERADVVCLARDPDFTYAKLEAAANAVAAGAEVIATNPDLIHPGAGARLVPETGSLLRALLACAEPRRMRVIGKPAPDLFLEAMARLAAKPSECVMIGDNAATDGEGARALGMAFVPVGAAAGAADPAVVMFGQA